MRATHYLFECYRAGSIVGCVCFEWRIQEDTLKVVAQAGKIKVENIRFDVSAQRELIKRLST
jgi:hypothetical protein